MAMYPCLSLPSLSFPSVSGSVCNFNSQYAGLPLKSCVSQISGYQEGSGTPSPSNVRPLVSFPSASLGKCDNNTASLWSIDNSFNGDVEFNQLAGLSGVNTQTSSNVTFTKNNDNSYTISGTANGRVLTSAVVIDRFYTVTGHKYLFNISESITPLRLREQNSSLPFISGSTVVNCSEGKNAYFTFDSTVDISGTSFNVSNLYINIFDLTQMFGSTIADYIYNLETQTAGAGVAFFKALYPNDYYPYTAGTKQLVGDTLATFTFGQSIYQGYIDWKRGVVRGDYIVKTIDENSLIDMTSIPSVFYWDNFFDFTNDTESVDCNCYVKDTNRANPNSVFNSNQDLTFCCRTSAPTLYIKDTRFTTIEDYKTWLSTNPVKIAVKLATPIEIQLSGTQIETQGGVNNVFADTGDTTLQYIKLG